MKLNDNDYREIASRIEEGSDTIEYEKDGELLHIDYTFEVEGYREDDYYNGTGAFVETSRNLIIENVKAVDIDGNTKNVDMDESLLERLIA